MELAASDTPASPPGPPRRNRLASSLKTGGAIGLLLVAAAGIGVATARPRIPAGALQPPAWAPVGQTLPVVAGSAAGFPSQRHLNDYLFAAPAGIPPESLSFWGSARVLRKGEAVEVLRADLDYLLVKPAGEDQPLWIEARALGVEPPARSKGRE